MSSRSRLPHLPYVVLGAMTVASFGGPFLMFAVVRGGNSAGWPPDRPLEWITIALVVGLVIALFFACVAIGWWPPQPRRTKPPPGR
jgi:hypothetical protein